MEKTMLASQKEHSNNNLSHKNYHFATENSLTATNFPNTSAGLDKKLNSGLTFGQVCPRIGLPGTTFVLFKVFYFNKLKRKGQCFDALIITN